MNTFKINNLYYQSLFAICVIVTYLNIYELTFLVWTTTAFITLKKKYSFTILNLVLLYSGIFVTAFFSSFFTRHSLYDFIRDVTYMIKPILGLLIGYQICKSYKFKLFETIIYTGVIIAIYHLVIILFNIVVYRIINIHELRNRCGYFSDFEVYSLIILIFHDKFEIYFSKKRFYLLLIILAISSFLYLSRTNFIQFAILAMAMKGYFILNKKSFFYITSIALFTLACYTLIYNMHLTRDGGGLEALLYKIKNAPIEAFKTKVDANDWADFNDNYRSYENILTVRQVGSEGINKVFFGKGLGSTINLGRMLWTNDGEFIQYLPTLHNGFATVYLKSGLLGLLFIFIILYKLSKQKKSDIPLIQYINFLLMGSGICLIISHWVLLGLYLKSDNKSIIIGMLICYRELIMKNNNKISSNE